MKGILLKIIQLILIIFILSILACAQNLKIMWDAADTADRDSVYLYIVYKFEGDSITWQNWQLSDMDSIGTILHMINYSGPYIFETYFQEGKIIRAGCIAIGRLKRRSDMALSEFYFYPDIPIYVRIKK
jgi:hypothetical protein